MIVINGRFLSQRLTGIQRFAYEITQALMQMTDVLVVAPQNIRKEYITDGWNIIQTGGVGSHWWEQITLGRYMLKHLKGETLLNLSGLSPIMYRHNIITIHDVAYLLRPRLFGWAYCIYYQLMTPIAARRAKRVLTVSHFSKSEICHYLHLPQDKITVVYNAVRRCSLADKKEMPRYILSVCSLSPRKNLKRMIRAYMSIAQKDFELYLIGEENNVFSDPELQQWQHEPNIHFLGYVADPQLQMYYRNALAYVSASIYEGFGIPTLEAMQQQCPSVLSDIPAYREVCGDAGLYFDPYNEEDIRNKMVEITYNSSLRAELISKQQPQLQRFSWEQSAKTILENL